ncbi:MAG TPA: TauD/TfdA family dioxygenase [Planctomycetota bacterium]|nr:TauD/TfdA family dioxygenase [Planctomycetota bacterium]
MSTTLAELPPLQTGRAAWLGPEMAKRTDWIVELAPGQIAELEAAARPFVASGDAALTALAHLDPSRFPLPTLGPLLVSLREELLRGRGFFLLRGLPVQRYGRLESAAIFLGLGAHLGRARSQNAKGHVLGHVYDLGLRSDDPNVRIYQTRERQTFHTDSCDVVGLLCLQEARRGGDSLLVSALSIFNEMRTRSPELLARLLLPMPHDRRGEVPEGMKPFFEIPVFSWLDERLTVFYQRQYFESAQRFPEAPRLTAEDRLALDRFDALAGDPRLHMSMRLRPGDMQFVHNHDLLHDRTGFEDWPEPERRRHLLRLWLACPGARRLPRAFEARYGSVEVGDRGGIRVPGTRMRVPLTPE